MITIDKDFKYEKHSTLQQEDDTNRDEGVINITLEEKQPDNRKKFHFDKDSKPALVVQDGQDISELLNIPAFRRKSHKDE